MLGIAKKLFGSPTERKVKSFAAKVAKINALEPQYQAPVRRGSARQD